MPVMYEARSEQRNAIAFAMSCGSPGRLKTVRFAIRSFIEAFALWKAAVFCEAIYKRYLRGERADDWSASLCDGVPRLLEVAAGYL